VLRTLPSWWVFQAYSSNQLEMFQGSLWCCVCVCVCVCVFSTTAFPFNLKVSHDTLGVSEVLQGLLRCLGGGITRGLAEGALAASLAGSGELVVASLKETRGVLWRVGGGITQGSAGIALAF